MSTLKGLNVMVGKWQQDQRQVVFECMRSLLDELKRQKTAQYKALEKYFPFVATNCSKEEELEQFVTNSLLTEKMRVEVDLDEVIVEFIRAMGREPNVGMLVIEMFRQQQAMSGDDGNPCTTVPDALFMMNSMLKISPRLVNDEGTVCCPIIFYK